MQPGEHRTLKMFEAKFNKWPTWNCRPRIIEPTKLRSGSQQPAANRNGHAVGQTTRRSKQTVWADRTGEVLEDVMPMLGGLETYRVTQGRGPGEGRRGRARSAAEHDGQGRSAAGRRPSDEARSAIASIWTGAIRRAFLSPARRRPSSRSTPHTAEITVYAIRPGRAGRQPQCAGRSAHGRRSAAEQL